MQVKVDTSDGDFDVDLYSDGDVVQYPINGKVAGDSLVDTGIYSVLSDTAVKLFYHSYIGAIRDGSNTTGGYIKIKQFRLLAYR